MRKALETAATEQQPLHATHIDFIRAGLALHGGDAPSYASARRQDYVTRRYALFHGSDAHAPLDAVAMSAISRLPLALQVAFRLKMLTIFALQLLLVWAVVTVFRFHPQAKDLADRFFDPPVARIVVAFVAALVLLVALYYGRNAFPLNWLLLLLFSGAQSFCFVGLGVVLDTNIGVFNCGFTFACLLIMILLSGMRHRRKQHDSLEESVSSEGEGELLSSFAAGAIAYLVAAAATCVLFAIFRHDLMTDVGFAATLGFQLALIGWFAYDASSMYRVMSRDEYMHGVIYFYTDLSSCSWPSRPPRSPRQPPSWPVRLPLATQTAGAPTAAAATVATAARAWSASFGGRTATASSGTVPAAVAPRPRRAARASSPQTLADASRRHQRARICTASKTE